MRGRRDPQVTMLAFIDPEMRVASDHPLRTIKALAGEALAELSPVFDRRGRPALHPAGAAAEGIPAYRLVLGAE